MQNAWTKGLALFLATLVAALPASANRLTFEVWPDGLARKMWRAPTEEPGGVLWETGIDRRRSFGVRRCGLH